MPTETERQFLALFGLFLIVGGIVVSLSILAVQSYFWLRTGVWHPCTNADALDFLVGPIGHGSPEANDWAGLRQIVAWVGRQSFGATIFLLGFTIGVPIVESAER